MDDAADQPSPVSDEIGAEGDTAPETESPNAEAARWRVKLREAEQQRDALAAQLDSMRREQVDAQVTAAGVKADAFWAAGVNVNDLLADSGVVDSAKVSAAVKDVRERFGIDVHKPLRRGLRSGTMPPQHSRDGWRDAFAPRER